MRPLATPLAWFVNTLWLEQIGNRVDLGVGVFIGGIGALLLLGLGTLGSQAMRAARANPVDALQRE